MLDKIDLNCVRDPNCPTEQCKVKSRRRQERKDLVVIGNGPSAITLSYMLDGNWPYYRSDRTHPNEYVHARLRSNKLSERELSLVEHDLEYLSSGLEGRSINPVSVLMDTLQHPEADFGLDLPSSLEWHHSDDHCIDHVVIGRGGPGGSWDTMADCTETLTVSFGQWMQLPNMCMKQWNFENERSGNRITLGNVAKYYKDYVRKQGLDKYFMNHSTVTKVKFDYRIGLWRVRGFQEASGKFEYLTPKVVLATGNSDSPHKLAVPGDELPFVLHSVPQLEQLINRSHKSNLKQPILVVGAGLSAADAIIAAFRHQVPIVHAFRRHPDDPSLIFNQLPENIYPEYHEVHALMKGDTKSVSYIPFPMYTVAEMRQNREVVLRNMIAASDTQTTTRHTVKVSNVLVLIGRKPNLDFIKPRSLRKSLAHTSELPINPRSNPIKIDPFSHQCLNVPGMYAIGPLVGDNFVRFCQGAALAIVNHVWKERKEQFSGV
ncbi:Oxidative stress-induced growth inhibitor 2 [Halotydeus destructor]|nr:Oxidative stress-induced growth inhibitor 2 [Halotydeus destructor]